MAFPVKVFLSKLQAKLGFEATTVGVQFSYLFAVYFSEVKFCWVEGFWYPVNWMWLSPFGESQLI